MLRTVIVAILLLAPALAGLAGAAWERPLEIAAGRGDRGPWRQNDTRYDYVDDGTAVFSPGGGIYVAWVEQRGKDVWLRSIEPGGRPKAPVNVSRNPASFSWLPRIAVDPARPRRVYVLWQEIIFSGGSHGGDILFAASRDGGRSFGAPLNLSNSPAGDGKGRLSRTIWSNGSLDLAVGGDGALLAAWTEYHGKLWLARSDDGGASFAPPRHIAGNDALPARAPALAAGPGASVHLAWTVGEDAAARIRVARSDDGGLHFAALQRVAEEGGRADAPDLALDGAGRLHLVYALHGMQGAPAQVRYTAAAPDGRFAAARTLSAPGTDAGYPALARAGAHGLVAVWEQLGPAGRGRSLGIALSGDGGRSFAPAAELPGSRAPAGGANGSQQGLLGRKLAADGAGRIAVVNSSLVPGQRSRVWLLRGRIASPIR